jgi:hypothetical protein
MSKTFLLIHNSPRLWDKVKKMVERRGTTIKALILQFLKEEVKKEGQ